MAALADSELILNDDNHVYHLSMGPDTMADKIILVGDPDRVALVSDQFDLIEHTSQHREFVKVTGVYNGKRITVLSTGIGTGNIDIVMNELDALANIDLGTRTVKQVHKSLDIIRIGTCGLLQVDVPIHSYILTQYACGFDNTADFYDIIYSSEEEALNTAFNVHVNMPKTLQTYTSAAAESIVRKLESDKTLKGITATSCGFYGPQGRQLRLKTKCPNLNDELTSFRFPPEQLRVLNFEMESSILFALGNALGHQCGTICLAIANRAAKEFSEDPTPHMKQMITYVLDRI
jgi:uridine phosphorylase